MPLQFRWSQSLLELCEREVSGETRALCEGAGRRQWRLVPLVSRCDALQGTPCPASSSDSSVGLINLGKLGSKRPRAWFFWSPSTCAGLQKRSLLQGWGCGLGWMCWASARTSQECQCHVHNGEAAPGCRAGAAVQNVGTTFQSRASSVCLMNVWCSDGYVQKKCWRIGCVSCQSS